jgi:predicted DNA-binding transcriptional regulator AlpA
MMRESSPVSPDRIDEILDLAEAADFLRMSSSWIERSDVPRVKLGRSVRYLRSELLAYARAHLSHSVNEELR